MVSAKTLSISSTNVSCEEVDCPVSPQRILKGAALIEPKRRSSQPAGLPTLQLSCNGTVLQEASLELPRFLIGRSEDNDMSIPSDYVSWHHILLVRDGSCVILIDLNSTNGTFVNSKRVYNQVLADEDEITVDRHSPFMQYSIKYTDLSATIRGASEGIEPANEAIKKALAEIGNALEKSDTDLLPTLTETVVGIVDDR
jgi:hypothetical protein